MKRSRGEMILLALAGLAVVLLALSWGRQAVWALRLAINYPPRKLAELADHDWPYVTVCVPLRGADPVLADTLRGLCTLDYPRYEIRVVVDSLQDSAWPAVRAAMAEFPQVEITATVLTERLETCGLKVSALLQAFRDLDANTQLVALIDADCVPHPRWLRELARPFADPKVAAASGVRWFHTDCRNWGSLVRGLWGMGAAAQMYCLDILWGGSLAFRAAVVRDPGLQELWARSFVEDTSAVGYLRQHGHQMRVLPRLTMINPESTSLVGCYRFLRRQMVCMRLHHPAWANVFLTTIGMAASPLVAAGVAVTAFLSEEVWLGWSVLGALAAFVLAAGLPIVYIDWTFWMAAPEDKPLSTLHPKHAPVVPLTILLQLAAVLAAWRVREVDWRGIRYAIGRDGSVRRLNDVPYAEAPADNAASIV